MKAFTLVYEGTNEPVAIGDIIYTQGKAYTYMGDWDIIDVVRGMGMAIVDTDRGMVEAHTLGLELAYKGE